MAQLELLTALTEHPGARPGQLARRLNMRPNTVTTIVNALSAHGMLDRVTASGDRRAVELTVTEAGREAVLAWQATNAAVLNLAALDVAGQAAPRPGRRRSRPRRAGQRDRPPGGRDGPRRYTDQRLTPDSLTR